MDAAIRFALACASIGALTYLFALGLRWRGRALAAEAQGAATLQQAKRLEVEREVLRGLLLRAGIEVATSWDGADDLRVRAAWIRQGHREGRA